MRPALIVVLGLLVASPVGAFTLPFGRAAPQAPSAPPRPVVSEIIEGGTTTATVRSIPGVIAAGSEVQMAFQTLGRMIARPVDVGDRVRAGDLLARLDPEDLAGATRAAEAALASAEVDLTTARNAADRARSLAERNVASTAQLEQAERALSGARSAVEQARAQLESARDAEGHAIMTAPIDGVVSAVRAAPGAVVAAGDPILTLSSEDELEATVDLPEAELAGVGPGTEFIIAREQGDGQPIRGRVDRVSPVADPQTRTRRIHIELPPDSGLRLGSLVRASRVVARTGALTVPAGAVLDGPQGPAVWTVRRQDGTAAVALQPVVTGARVGDRIEVIKGLAPGAEIVTRGVHSLADGQPVGRRVAP